MRLLVCVDGSRWAYLALQFAGRRLERDDEVVLLTVCPRAGAGYLECGRMVLEAAERICAPILNGARLRTRLMVGDPRAVIPLAAAEEQADLVVMGAVGGNGLPYGPSLGDTTHTTWKCCERPVLVGSPHGVELLVGEETLRVASRQELAPRRAPAGDQRPMIAALRERGASRGVPAWAQPDVSQMTSRPPLPVRGETAPRGGPEATCDADHIEEVAALTATR